MTAILSYRIEHDRHTLLLKSATKQLKMSNSLLHFLLKTAILNFYLHLQGSIKQESPWLVVRPKVDAFFSRRVSHFAQRLNTFGSGMTRSYPLCLFLVRAISRRGQLPHASEDKYMVSFIIETNKRGEE